MTRASVPAPASGSAGAGGRGALPCLQLEAGTLSIGGLVALILYVERLVFPTALLGFTLNTFQTGQVSLERVEELLQRQPLIQDRGNHQDPGQTFASGRLEARGLSVRYEGAERDTLIDLSFSIEPGELVAIVGPVGCGKTTLARAFGRMVPVQDGQLFLDGIDVTMLPLGRLRRDVAMVPQEGFLFTSTLADNLRYGEPDAPDERVEKAADQARLIQDVRGFPDGFSTIVGERGITLSGGQRQRTALGRALSNGWRRARRSRCWCSTMPSPASTTTRLPPFWLRSEPRLIARS